MTETKNNTPDLTPSMYNPYEPIKDFVLENGVLKIRVVGVRNVDEEIKSYQDSCGMDFVLASLARGDASVIGTPGVYGDFTGAPTNLAEVIELNEAAEKSFSQLPDNIKNGRSMEDVISLSKEQLQALISEAVNAKLEASKNEVIKDNE